MFAEIKSQTLALLSSVEHWLTIRFNIKNCRVNIYFNRAWGKLVFTKGMAPCFFNTLTITLSSCAGWSKLTTTPQEQS